jgi:hypothetical protein
MHGQGGMDLRTAVLWPTATVSGNHNRAGLSETSGDGLSTATKQWPTPTTPRPHDSENTVGVYMPTQNQIDLAAVTHEFYQNFHPDRTNSNSGEASSQRIQNSPQRPRRQLNVLFVEWMMGIPKLWTDAEAELTDFVCAETDASLTPLKSPSESSLGDLE